MDEGIQKLNKKNTSVNLKADLNVSINDNVLPHTKCQTTAKLN